MIEVVNLFTMYKKFGPPWNGGWADWPAWFIDLVTELERAEVETK